MCTRTEDGFGCRPEEVGTSDLEAMKEAFAELRRMDKEAGIEE